MKRIFGLRNSLLGDVVTCLPMIHVLQKMYGSDISITQCLANKCKQMAPLLISQPGIESIYITQDEECLNDKEREWISKDFDLFIETNPPEHNPRDWYNHKNMVDETIIQAGEQYYEVFQTLPEELKKPRLNPWWTTKDNFKYEDNVICIFPFAGYGRDLHRSPSKEWWVELISLLIKNGYQIKHFGHFSEPSLWAEYGDDEGDYKKYTYLSLFEQIRICYQYKNVITTDSGTGWICGALGMEKQINLITSWLSNHHTNPLALAATNWKNDPTTLFAPGGCDNISIKNVLEVIENS